MVIKRPRLKHEIETLRWYLHFDTVQIYIRSHRWHLLVKGKCIYLSKKNLCTIYDRRPDVCRDHSSDACEMSGQWYDQMFTTPKDLDAYFNKKRKKR